MSKLLKSIENIMSFLALVSAFIMVCLTTADAGLRYLFNWPIIGAYEVTERYLLVFCVFFAMCYAYQEGANIRVTFLVQRLPAQVKLAFDYFVQIFSILFCLSLLVTTFIRSLRGISDTLMVSRYNIPLGPAYMVVPVGLFFVTLRMVLDLWQIKKGKSSLFKEEEELPTT